MSRRTFWIAGMLGLVFILVEGGLAQTPASAPASTAASQAAAAAAAGEKCAEPEWTKPIPLTFNLTYVYTNKYIFRGINFSDGPGMNDQLTLNAEYDTKSFGVFGATGWFEWFQGQKHLTPWAEGNLQEVDYSFYWKYLIEPIGTTFETGYIHYTFPPYRYAGAPKGSSDQDGEWYFKLAFDDSKWFGTKTPIFSPYYAFYLDTDAAAQTSWMEVGISHAFALSDLGMGEVPVLKNITLTPSMILGMQNGYYAAFGLEDSSQTRCANLQWGLDAAYDVSSAFHISPKYGKMTLGGFLYWSEALDTAAIQNQLYGGLKLGYSW